jgi:hypothetical protein
MCQILERKEVGIQWNSIVLFVDFKIQLEGNYYTHTVLDFLLELVRLIGMHLNSRVCIGNELSDPGLFKMAYRNEIKYGQCVSTLLWNVSLGRSKNPRL